MSQDHRRWTLLELWLPTRLPRVGELRPHFTFGA
ncbi:hypothetical protein MAR_007320 [Mya arenaria]|uniref:Uncharacterized protein n=1 Tax=Mya arenaria TaxID=6604 RepID=A0ABY7DEK3_MYAAR|nr:hypothetical protein MAR_007320 [Mya arenaria]